MNLRTLFTQATPAETQAAIGWETVAAPTLWWHEREVGLTIEGFFESEYDGPSRKNGGMIRIATFRLADGSRFDSPLNKDLERKMRAYQIGDYLKFTYLGQERLAEYVTMYKFSKVQRRAK